MVEPAPKRTSPVDRISDLPEPIISDILSSIPTKDAVATSILSRSWRFRWTRVTSFNFERRQNQFNTDEAAPTFDFSDFVNMVLLKHSGESINKFVLCWDSSHFRSGYLNLWANTAIARKVRVLDLNTGRRPEGQGEFHLPFSLYTSATLEVLKLSGPFHIKPPSIIHLPKLAEMVLTRVIYESDESLPILLSVCPFLESLTIERADDNDNMVVCSISSPTLKQLTICFFGGPVFLYDNPDLELKMDAPSLEYLNLYDYMSSHISIQQNLGNVKFLSIQQNLAGWFGRTLLSVSFEGVASLKYKSNLEWTCLMDVLDSCSNLEKLEIWCFDSNNKRVGRGPRSLFSSLRCLTFRNFNGRKKEMEMLRFFLDHGVVLETITLSSYHPNLAVKKAKIKRILNVVAKWSRASPTCKISWHEFPELDSCFEPFNVPIVLD